MKDQRSRTFSEVAYLQNIETPRKKAKMTDMDPSAVLTDLGISNYFLGKHDEAETCFTHALCQVDPVQSPVRRAHTTIECDECDTKGLQIESLTKAEESSRCDKLTSENNDYDEGMDVYDEPIRNSSDPETAICALHYNIAQTHARRGQYKKAEGWFQRALARCESSIKDQDVALIAMKTLHNLGNCSYRMGDTGKALQRYKHALVLIEQHQLGKHALASTLNCIGVVRFHAEESNMNDIMALFQKSLSIFRSMYGVSSGATEATILNNIGRVHYNQTQYDDAIRIYTQAVEMRREHLGNLSIDTAAAIFNQGQCFHKLGKLNESLNCYKEFVHILGSRYGKETADTALAYKGMAEIHQERKEAKLALHFYVQALQAQRVSLGKFHQDIASTLNLLGNLCFEMKDFETSLQYYKDGLHVEKYVLEHDHPHIMITLTNIGHVYKTLGQCPEALIAFQQVYKLQREKFGDESLQVAETLCNIGLIQYHGQDYVSAFDSYQESLRIRRMHHGDDDHLDIASTLNSIGLVLFKQSKFELAKSCFAESLRIRKLLLGADHKDVAILWYNIGTIHFEMGEDDVAIRFYKETLRVERASLGENNPDVALTLQHLGQVFQQLGHLDEALKYFQEAIEIEKKQKGWDQYCLLQAIESDWKCTLTNGKHKRDDDELQRAVAPLQVATVARFDACYCRL